MNLFLTNPRPRPGYGSLVLVVPFSRLFATLCLTSFLLCNMRVNGQTLGRRGKLIKTVFQDYDSWDFPGNTTVVVGASLISLNKGFGDTEPLVTNILLKQLWFDPRLVWDPRQFGGQRVLSVPSGEVWKPEVKLLNSISLPTTESCAQSKVTIRNTGHVVLATPCQFQSYCISVNETFGNGPFNCSLKFGVWAWDGSITDFQFYDYEPKLDLELFEDVTKWNVTGSNAKRVEKVNISNYDLFPVTLVFEIFVEQKMSTSTIYPALGGGYAGAPAVGSGGTADCTGGERDGSDGGCQPGAEF